MSFSSTVSGLCRAALRARLKIAAVAFLSVGTMTALAGPDKVYGRYWAWDNNFQNSNLPMTFGNGSSPTWSVQVNDPTGSSGLIGYPASIFGWHYGWNPANDNTLPKRVSSISHCNTTFSYSASGTQMGGDFAYDMFMRNDSSKSSPQLEIMVWGHNRSGPIGSATKIGALNTGGVTYDLWEGNNSAAGYYVFSFVPSGSIGHSGYLSGSGSVNVDMKVFYNWLAANRGSRFNNNMYLDVIEAGCEITRGVGTIQCTGFSVNVG